MLTFRKPSYFMKRSIIIGLTSPLCCQRRRQVLHRSTVSSSFFTTSSLNCGHQLFPNFYLGLDLFVLRRLELCAALRFVLEFLDCLELSVGRSQVKENAKSILLVNSHTPAMPKTHLLCQVANLLLKRVESTFCCGRVKFSYMISRRGRGSLIRS